MKKEQQFLEILYQTMYRFVLRKPHWLLFLHAACPAGTDYCNEEAGIYYEFVQSNANWYGANIACENNGGQLAVLDPEDVFNWMKDLRMNDASGK